MREPMAKLREPQGFAARASRAARAYATESWRTYATALAAGVFLALAGPFGSAEASLGARFLFWVPLAVIGSAIGAAIAQVTSNRPRIGENRFGMWAVVSLLAALPTTFLSWGLSSAMFGGRGMGDVPFFLGASLVISAAMTAIMMLVNTPGAATHAPPQGAPAAKVRFLERLPPKLMGAVLYAVEAEDHYLRLHTSKGSDLLLFRLADAIAELDGLEGAQTHRSWWVSRDAVKDVRRDGGRMTLVLSNGAEAPVSRPNVKALKEAGWV